jgi:hypothetical protein
VDRPTKTTKYVEKTLDVQRGMAPYWRLEAK